MMRRNRHFLSSLWGGLAIGFLSLLSSAQLPPRQIVRFGGTARARTKTVAASNSNPRAAAGQSSVNLSVTMIDFPRSPDTTAQGLNSRGDVVGLYGPNLPAYQATEQSYVLEGNTFQELVYPGASYTLAAGINKSRRIVGGYVGPDNNLHAFLRKGKAYENIDFPGSDNTTALNINDAGVIVGIRYQNTTGTIHGYILKKGVYTTIDPPGSIFTEPTAINSGGVIAGFYLDQDQASHGFVLENGLFTTVDYPGADNTEITGINDQGQMVGGYGDDAIIGDEDWQTPNAFFLEQGNFTPIHLPFGDVQVNWTYTLNGNQFAGMYVDSLGNIYGYLATISQ